MTEWDASNYARESSLQKAVAEEQLSRLTLEGGEQVLDVGCGDGKLTAEIAAKLPRGRALGVDPSADMVAFASNHFGARENLRFEVADARRLPYREQFDLVLSFNALHWVPEQDQALGSIRAGLKAKGRAWLRFVPEGRRKSLEDCIEDVRVRTGWAGYFAGFRKPYIHVVPDEYRALAERCGLRVQRLEVQDKAWDFETREGFVAFAHATFVEWTRRLPKDKWHEFIVEVLDLYRTVAAEKPAEANVFKFYQMEVELSRE